MSGVGKLLTRALAERKFVVILCLLLLWFCLFSQPGFEAHLCYLLPLNFFCDLFLFFSLTEILCPSLEAGPGSRLLLPPVGDFVVGSLAQYECLEGHVAVSGDALQNCTLSGQWSGSPLSCTADPTEALTHINQVREAAVLCTRCQVLIVMISSYGPCGHSRKTKGRLFVVQYDCVFLGTYKRLMIDDSLIFTVHCYQLASPSYCFFAGGWRR